MSSSWRTEWKKEQRERSHIGGREREKKIRWVWGNGGGVYDGVRGAGES